MEVEVINMNPSDDGSCRMLVRFKRGDFVAFRKYSLKNGNTREYLQDLVNRDHASIAATMDKWEEKGIYEGLRLS